MSDRVERWIDAGVGETREALAKDGRAFALNFIRASEEGRRARWGEYYAARVKTVDKRLRGAFVDLGLSEDVGFLPVDSAGAVRRRDGARTPVKEGAALVVAVAREAARGKGPVLELVNSPHPGGAPQRIGRHESDEALVAHARADMAQRALLDEAFEEALSARVAVPGGGTLAIEPTAALVAIDVDAGGRKGSGDPEKFALDLNLAAADEIARQLRLRNLGGIIAVDFVSMRTHASRTALEGAMKAAVAGDPWGVQTTRLSRFGVMEMARAQLCTPLHERLAGAETHALALLRAIEREAVAATGRQIAATASGDVVAWLDAAPFDWRGALTNRIGPRWRLERADGAPAGLFDIRAL